MNEEIDKIEVAIEYLNTAATLWIHEINYFSAMHLAGAAEELAGKACRIAKKNAHFDDIRLKVKKTLSPVGIDHTDRELIEAFYGAKNAVKHMDSKNDSVLNIDARKESADYIFAAYRNFEKLGLQDALSAAVKQVVDANTIYVEVNA